MSIVILILTIAGLVIDIVLLSQTHTSFLAIIISVLPYIINICLLWELHSDTKKINRLEDILLKKGVIRSDEIYDSNDIARDTPQKESAVIQTNVKKCPHCNFLASKDSDICPNCQMPISTTNQKK